MQIPDLPQRLVPAELLPSSITIVVCTHERPRELERCLRSLRLQTRPPAEIVVVDNAPANAAARQVAAAAGARYVPAPLRGVSRARNAGARHCLTPLLAFIDDDMVAHPAWLDALHSAFDDSEVIAVTGPVMPMDLVRAPPGELARNLLRQPWGVRPFHVAPDCADWFERAHFGGIGDGNMAFRAEAFRQWPGFEERIGRGSAINGGEEHYAFFELIERGHRIAYAPEAMVFHPERPESADGLLRSISETAAYCCFVAANHPEYAFRILRYLLQGVLGARRSWRPPSRPTLRNSVPATAAAAAFLRGVLAYRQSRREGPHDVAPTGRSREATLQ